jgi:RHH-type rel operon transcriptional repressor/antitoxin RelB
MSKQTAVRLSDETYERLKTLASQTGRTTTYYIREAIEEYLEDLEDIYLSGQILERVRQGKERTYPLEEMRKKLGLAD